MSNRVNGKEHRKGRSTRELHYAIPAIAGMPIRPNDSDSRVNMYAAAIAAGEELPYHLANNPVELAKFPNEVLTYEPDMTADEAVDEFLSVVPNIGE